MEEVAAFVATHGGAKLAPSQKSPWWMREAAVCNGVAVIFESQIGLPNLIRMSFIEPEFLLHLPEFGLERHLKQLSWSCS
jgi:hypothetical protein